MSKESVATTLRQMGAAPRRVGGQHGEIKPPRGAPGGAPGLVAKARALSGEQDALNARKQQVTRDLDTLLLC